MQTVRRMAARLHMVVAAPVLMAAAFAEALTWPGDPPCAATLQGCIDGAAPQSTVEIASNGPIDENLRIEKSLTLRAAAGFTPELLDRNSVTALGGTDGDRTITVEGLSLRDGGIHALQDGSGVLMISILNNTLRTTEGVAAIRLESLMPSSLVSVIFDVSGNSITIEPEPSDRVSGISMGGGLSAGIIARNVISQLGGAQSCAIELRNGASDVTVDIIANEISGANFNKGIGILQSGGGNTTARIINNLLSGQTNLAGAPAAVSLVISGGSGHFVVINNTIAHNERGIVVSGRTDLGAVVTGIAANNIIAFNEQGLVIAPNLAGTFANHFNVVFGNLTNSFSPGRGTILTDPVFVAATDYHLHPSSPAIDAGRTADLPADATTDLDGSPRVVGRAVDCGAYESPGCAGDCDGDLHVAIDELILGVNIALGHAAGAACPAFDTDGSGSTAINELIASVSAALQGCPIPTPIATRTPTRTHTPTPMSTPTFSPTPVPGATRTRTPGSFCGASAPECGGMCPIRRICEPDGEGGCHCVDINDPLRPGATTGHNRKGG